MPEGKKFDIVRDLCLEYLEEHYPSLSFSKIASLIIEEGNYDGSRDYLRMALSHWSKNQNREYIEFDDFEEELPWEVVDENYIWKTKHGTIKMPVYQIDKFFYEYSEHGLDLSQIEMINKHNLKDWQWNSIKSRLKLYKKSNIFSPYTVENTPPDRLEEMIKEKFSEAHERIGEIVEKQYKQTLHRHAKKILRETAGKDLFLKHFNLEYIKLPTIKSVYISKNKIRKPLTRDGFFAIADLHAGAHVQGLKITSDYDSEICRQRLRKVSERINSLQCPNVTLAILGDLIESFTGLNHKSSWQSMEHGVYGARAFWNALDILYEFIGSVNNVNQILGVSGNHDRGDSSKDTDPYGQIGLIIYEHLKRTLNKQIDVIYDPLVVSHTVDNINYILLHGDDKVSKNKTSDLVVKYGDSKLFNVIISAHLHTFKVPEDKTKYMRVYTPSIFEGNYWAEAQGYDPSCGFLQSINNGFGKPNVMKYSL